jgi:hypothetical protein
MTERGVIRNIRFARQRADFKGMRFGTITPTDIDGFIEFDDEVFIFMETKHLGAELPNGQRLALERVCDRVQAGGGEAIVLVLHNGISNNASPTYELAPLPVSRCRYKGKWFVPKETLSACQAIEKFSSQKLGRKIEAEISKKPPEPQIDEEWLKDYNSVPSDMV